MTAVPKQRDHTEAVYAALAAAGMTVGKGKPPDGAALPYLVVRGFGMPPAEGPVSDQHADVSPNVLVRGVGLTQDSAEIVADLARGVLLTAALTVPGRVVTQVKLEVSQPTQQDQDVSPSLYYTTDVYGVWTTPAT